MSIPRAKVTHGFATCEECDETPFPAMWFGRVLSLGDIADSAREHLRDAHGVRTVGSLTADDIGKWIEVEDGLSGILTSVTHETGWKRPADRTSIINVTSRSQVVPSSTVCRVTGFKP